MGGTAFEHRGRDPSPSHSQSMKDAVIADDCIVQINADQHGGVLLLLGPLSRMIEGPEGRVNTRGFPTLCSRAQRARIFRCSPSPRPSPPAGVRINLSTPVCHWGGESLDTDSHRFTQIDSVTARWLCTHVGRHMLSQDPTSPLEMGRNAQGHSYQRRERTERKGIVFPLWFLFFLTGMPLRSVLSLL